MKIAVPLAAAILLTGMAPATAGTPQAATLDHFQKLAGTPASPERGKTLFEAEHTGGKPQTRSCTACHGKAPSKSGKTRAGKIILPMALSQTPDRYADLAKVEKWFRRNCNNVLGRACTAQEKSDFLAFMMSQ